MTLADLMDYEFEIRCEYLSIAQEVRHPRPPVLQNTDGDPIRFTTLTYRIDLPVAEALARVASLGGSVEESGGEGQFEDETRDDTGVLTGGRAIACGRRRRSRRYARSCD